MASRMLKSSYMNFSWVLEGEVAGAQGPASQHDLFFLASQGVRAIVRMETRTVAGGTGGAVDLVDMFEPVADFTAPEQAQVHRMVDFIDTQVTEEERPTVVTCYAGIGRTGTVLACYLVHRGFKAKEAVRRVRELRPGSIQTREQEAAVYRYADSNESAD
ncbi:MAG: protein tyrosine phosphatase [SAR202 cluster bacterium]|nr:protein tyrosine phosphatase [SAR202 cluster bacterium]